MDELSFMFKASRQVVELTCAQEKLTLQANFFKMAVIHRSLWTWLVALDFAVFLVLKIDDKVDNTLGKIRVRS